MTTAAKVPSAETRRAEMPMEFRLAPVASVDAEQRTVEVTWTTGAKVRRKRYDYSRGGFIEFDESLEVTKSAVDMNRLATGAPALDNHNIFSTRAQVGVVEKAWLANGEGRAIIRFPKPGIDENADRIAAMVADRIIRNISVGYSIDRIRVVPPKGENEVEQRIVERWTPYELSFVTIGADAGAQVRSADHDETRTFPVEIVRADPDEKRSKKAMTTNSSASPAPLDGDKLKKFIRDTAKRHNLSNDFAEDLIKRGLNDNEVRVAFFDEMAARSDENSGHNQLSEQGLTRRSGGSLDDPDFRMKAMQGALISKMLPGAAKSKYRAPEGAEEFRSFGTLTDFAREMCERNNISCRGLSDMRIQDKAREIRSHAVGFGAQGIGDFTALMGGAAEQHMLERFRQAPSPLEVLGERRQFTDFRPQNFLRGSAFPELERLPEGGEIKNGVLDNSGETVTAATYAKITGLTRQALTNANAIGLFADLMNNAAESAIALKSNLIALAFESNPDLADGDPVFHANHANLASSGAAPDETTLSAARIAMRKQTGANNERISPVPRYLVVPSELETAAEKLVSTIQAATTDDANVFTNLQVLVEPRFSSAVAWYIAADPATALGFIYGYVGDGEGPMVDVQEGWRMDGTEFRVRMDFAAGFADYRPFYKNPGE